MDNVIRFAGSLTTITQTDLAEVAMWRQRRREADRELRRKQRMIENALEAGCEIEPGLREVETQVKKKLVFR